MTNDAHKSVDLLEKIKNLLVIVPAIHITICYLYIILYNLYFGEGLGKFSGPSDILTVSISEVAPAYFTLILGGLVGRALPSTFEKIGEPNGPTYGGGFGGFVIFMLKNYPAMAILLTAFMVSWLNFGFIALIIYLYGGYISFSILALFLTTPLMIFLELKIRDRRGKSIAMYASIFILSTILIGASALSNAQKDKFTHYDNLSKSEPMCGSAVILASRGDYFLAALPTNKRVLLERDCTKAVVLQYKFQEVLYISGSDALDKIREDWID